MNLLEFIKKFTTYKPPPYHEAFFEAMEKAGVEDSRRWYKDLCLSELLYSNIIKLKENQTFAVATPKGIHILKKTKFQSYSNESNITQHNTTHLKEKHNGKKQD